MHDPWRAFEELAGWSLTYGDLPARVWGETCWPTMTVTIDRSLSLRQQRSALAHENEHILRGPPPPQPILAAREELAVEKATARKLIPIRLLGEALAWASNEWEAAEELQVDVGTLRFRLAHLHPSERHYLRRRLQHDD